MKNFDIKNGRTALIIALSVILLLLVFKLGVFVGFHQARFSLSSNDEYYRVMDGKRNGPLGIPLLPDSNFSGGHGAVGRVVGVSLPNFVVASPDNFEKTIFVGPNTMIRKFRDSVGPELIDVDDFVSVLGNPTASGSIEAKFIRILPPIPTSTSAMIPRQP